jgi:hypothetical protein
MPGFGDAVQDQPAGAVKKCKTISPSITIAAPKIALVKKSHQAKAHRITMKIGATAGFQGTGALKCNSAKVKLFDAAGSAVALPYDNIPGKKLSDGITLHLEAAAASAALNDVTFTLTLAGGPDNFASNPATGSITCVELDLELCQYKPKPGGTDPAPLAGDKRVTEGRNLHLQTDDLYAGRALLIVKEAKPAAYAGSIVLKQSGDHLRLFDYSQEVPAQGQTAKTLPLSTLNPVIPGTGLKLWVEGAKESKALLDAALTVELGDLPKVEGDKALITVVKTELEIGQSRVKPKQEPAMMKKDRLLNPGRFVHLQDALDQYARAKIVAHRAEPSAFAGEFELEVLDAASGSAASPKLKIFDAETNGASSATPKKFKQTGAYPAAKGTDDLWAEGGAVSGALRDTEVRLRIADAEGYAGKALFTVASFTRIEAAVKSTPANTPGRSPAPADHVFASNKLDPDFARNAPLVLMKRAQPDVEVKVTAAPANLPILWQAVRNKDDHKDLGKEDEVPGIKAKANVYEATLDCNGGGSFRIRPYLDNNGDDKYGDGEPSIPLNLVLARVHIVKDNSKGINSNLRSRGIAGGVEIKNGTWPGTWPACTAANGAGMTMEIVADVRGGGANGRLGLDKVFGGLINMLTGNEITLTYTDTTPVAPNPPVVRTIRNRYVTNRGSATGVYNGTPMFKPGDPAPALLAFPVLDTGRNPGGLGGETAVMSSSGKWDLSVDRPVGQRRTLRCIDSPGRSFLAAHPGNPNAKLSKIHYVQRFRAHFCFWTNAGSNRGNTNAVADRTYSVKELMDWEAGGDWEVDCSAAVPTLKVAKKHKIKVSGRRTLKPIGRAQDNGIEVRPPSGITQAISWETT